MIPAPDPATLDPNSVIPEDVLAVLLESIKAFEDQRIEIMTESATKSYIKGDMIAHTRLDVPFDKTTIKDDIFSFLKTYKAQLDEGYTIIRGEKNYWLRDRTLKERQAIFDIISTGITEGKSPVKVAKDFQEYFGMQKRDAVTIARTETAYVQATGRDIRYKQSGVERVRWLLGQNPCEECQSYGGNIYTWVDLPASQPLHPRCSCDLSPVMD